MQILAIDPGPKESGWLVLDNGSPTKFGMAENNHLLARMPELHLGTDVCAIEMVAHYGTAMPAGESTFDTCVWIGRFLQRWQGQTALVGAKDVRMYLCGSMKAKPPNRRQALIDRFPATGGGKTPQIGTKGQPGPLYGIKKHIWSALGIAITYAGQPELYQGERR